jgi:hypothetical protein
MKTRLLFIAIAIACLLNADQAKWIQEIVNNANSLKSASQKEVVPLAKSLQMKKFIPAKILVADVTGLDEIWLMADDGQDGNSGDHTSWVDPILTTVDGKEVPGVEAPVTWKWTQWNQFTLNKNHMGEPIEIAGTTYKTAWWAHANSLFCVKLDKKYTKLQVGVGIDKRGDTPQQKVGFSIYAAKPLAWRVQEISTAMDRSFPNEAQWLRQDIGGSHFILLDPTANPTERLVKAINNLAEQQGKAGSHLKTKLQQLVSQNEKLDKFLELYIQAREGRNAMSDIDTILVLAENTLEFVEKSVKLPGYDKKLADLRKRVEVQKEQKTGDWATLGREVKTIRREILFKHPKLAFDDLLINKQPPPTYSHMVDQYLGVRSRPGPGLVVLKNWKSQNPDEIELLKGKLPVGSTHHPDLSYDGKKILFSFCDHSIQNPNHRRFFIYEIGVDGQNLRQITGTKNDSFKRIGDRNTVLIEDFDPCYLPDGGIAFISTRCQSYGRCHGGRYTPAYFLYRMDGDGSNIKQLSFGEANEWDPSVLSDGRIIYSRWDYINRHDTIYQSLWTIRPDGTGTAHFYGNYTRNPCMIAEPRAIPGSDKVLALAMAHHSYTAGSVIHLDTKLGEDGPEPITRVTPEARFPETEGWPTSPYKSAWPLSEDLTFVARGREQLISEGRIQAVNSYSIWLIDSLGGREQIYVDNEMSCVSPIPIQPRPVPPTILSTVHPNDTGKPGRVFIQNANLGRTDFGEKIKAIRVNSIICQPTAAVPSRSVANNEIVKRIEGIVPVREDGQAHFNLPSGIPIQLQALDKTGQAVMTMRTFIYVQPGELLSCVGCHENKNQAPPPARALNLGSCDDITPFPTQGYNGGFSFMKSVQPVLDKHCISCHGLGKATEKLDLRGIMPNRQHAWTPYSNSYSQLVNKPGMVRLLQRNQETGVSEPKDYFAHASKLAPKLLKGHCKSLLEDNAGLQTIIAWLDLNVQFFGDYSFSRVEGSTIDKNGEASLREAIKQRFGDELANQPFDTLVNVANPDQSRILNIALPTSDGGWNQIIKNQFKDKDDPDWIQFKKLVLNSFVIPKQPPQDGTCGLNPCRCRNCWVKNEQMKHNAKN